MSGQFFCKPTQTCFDVTCFTRVKSLSLNSGFFDFDFIVFFPKVGWDTSPHPFANLGPWTEDLMGGRAGGEFREHSGCSKHLHQTAERTPDTPCFTPSHPHGFRPDGVVRCLSVRLSVWSSISRLSVCPSVRLTGCWA